MVLMQDSKRGMSQTLTGSGGDNFYQKNQGRSKEARLVKATRTAAILFFVVTLVTNVFAIYFKGDSLPNTDDFLSGLEWNIGDEDPAFEDTDPADDDSDYDADDGGQVSEDGSGGSDNEDNQDDQDE